MEMVNPPEFSVAHDLFEQVGHRPAARLEVIAHQRLREFAAGAHELLKQGRMAVPRAHEIEVQTDLTQQDLARRPRFAEHLQGLAIELFEVVVEHGLVELFLALEVIIQQRLVGAGLGGNEIGAGASQAGPGEHALGGGQNRSAGSGSCRAAARESSPVDAFAHKLINWIVNFTNSFCQLKQTVMTVMSARFGPRKNEAMRFRAAKPQPGANTPLNRRDAMNAEIVCCVSSRRSSRLCGSRGARILVAAPLVQVSAVGAAFRKPMQTRTVRASTA